jgi:hypothetical protein
VIAAIRHISAILLAVLIGLGSSAPASNCPVSVTLETSAATMELEGGLQQLNSGPGMEPLGGPVLAREYVWGPGDAWHATPVDELLVYYGEGRVAYWPIQDAGGDVVAVCAPGGSGEGYKARVAAQQRYDAYGQVISADHIHPHAFLSVGHKGLFYDRLDRGVADDTATGAAIPPNAPSFSGYETPQIVPFSRGTYHVRNRTYIPGGGSPQLIGLAALTPTGPPNNPWSTFTLSQQGLSSGATVHGRWMQADPNATGTVVAATSYHAGTVALRVNDFGLSARFRDGANLLEYLGSNGWERQDSTGLFFGVSDVVMVGFGVLRGAMESMIGDYAANQDEDADWAEDWSTEDDGHSRLDNSWVATSFELGAWNGLIEELDPTGGYLTDWLEGGNGHAMSSIMGSAARKALMIARRHGGAAHQLLMGKALLTARKLGAKASNVRTNQQLIDGSGRVLSKMRPDVQAFIPPKTIFIHESAVSQSLERALSKWDKVADALRTQGYEVIVDVQKVQRP